MLSLPQQWTNICFSSFLCNQTRTLPQLSIHPSTSRYQPETYLIWIAPKTNKQKKKCQVITWSFIIQINVLWDCVFNGTYRAIYKGYYREKILDGVGDMAQWLRVLDACPEDQSTIPSTQVGQLVTFCNSFYSGFYTYFWLLRVPTLQ